MVRDLERREATLEVRRSAGAPSTLGGIAVPYGRPSADLGGFREVVVPGAFHRALGADADVLALFNHDRGKVLGRTRSGTLRLDDTVDGLVFAVDVPDTSDGRDVMELVGRGDIAGASVGFRMIGERWRTDTDGGPLRELIEAELIEISIVSTPAYPDTTVARRSLALSTPAALRHRYLDLAYGSA